MRESDTRQLVSVVLRSIGRSSIDRALWSVEHQDYQQIEIVIVNARAKPHPSLQSGLTRQIRLVQLNRDLNRPEAANVGLDNCQGEYIIFLDDDDHFEKDHISSLVACMHANPEYLVAYGGTRILGERDETRGELNLPFNRLELFRNNYIQIGAAIFSTRLLLLGCRFDEDMIMFQDWDFWIQASRWTAFSFTGKITNNWRAFSGGSGAGSGINFNPESTNFYAQKLLRKWASLRIRLMERYKYSMDRSRQLIKTGRDRDANKWVVSARSITSGKCSPD